MLCYCDVRGEWWWIVILYQWKWFAFNLFRHSLKFDINTDLLGLCGHVDMRVLAEGKISGIGNWQICFPYLMTLSSTLLALAIFVLCTLWGTVERYLPKLSGSNVRQLRVHWSTCVPSRFIGDVSVRQTIPQWARYPPGCHPRETIMVRCLNTIF